MYLTHMPLNPQRRSTRELVTSPQRLHAAVLAGFLPGVARRGRVLWRLDETSRHELDLYVASQEKPSFDALAEQAGWSANPVWRTSDYQPFLDRLRSGQQWVFRLTANPVRSVRDLAALGGARPRGDRVPLVRDADQREWLVARGEQHGFRIVDGDSGGLNLRVSRNQRRRFNRRSEGDQRTVTLQMAQFDGVLEVTDADALRGVLTDGLGSAKGYGCGLMTLAPRA